MARPHIGVTVLICAALSTVSANIQSKLVYFETLKATDFHHRVKRSPDRHTHLTEIKVTALGRPFHMFLHPSRILSDAFVASVIDGNGNSVPFNIDRDGFFTGTLADDSIADTNVIMNSDGIVHANIETTDDIYVFEPSWRHLPPSDNHSMIAYRKSDIKNELSNNGEHKYSTCGIKENVDNPELHGKILQDDIDPNRTKRQSSGPGARTTCQLMIVADYMFFQYMGGMSSAATVLYMINIIQVVNSVYRKTQFDQRGGSLIGVGFEIAEMRIHSKPFTQNETIHGFKHYNILMDHWDSQALLESFSMDNYFRRYCLAHLFTYHSFDDAILGLAYIASDKLAAVGGICSNMYDKYKKTILTLNTGWSSSRDTQGHRVLALEAQLVTAHELGHNMGSEHDTDNGDCAPSERHGGKYIMYPWSVSGYGRNNMLFSPCSKEYIFKVVSAKGYNCFVESRANDAFCGNGRLDENEECDVGYQAESKRDPCCRRNCTLRVKKKCSPMNYGCCSDQCQPASKGVVCRPALEGSCDDEVKCDGTNITCAQVSSFKNDSTPCIDQGVCYNGQCLNFCEVFNRDFTPCICDEASGHACYRCCRPKSEGGACEKVSDAYLPDGRPCYMGLCNKGICEKKSLHLVQRLFDIIEDITVDQLVEYMKTNIVGTVIVLSLLVWIPPSIYFCCKDRQEAKIEKLKRQRMRKSSRSLDFDEDESLNISTVLDIQRLRHSVNVNCEDDAIEESADLWPEDTWHYQRRPLHRPTLRPLHLEGNLPGPSRYHTSVSHRVGHGGDSDIVLEHRFHHGSDDVLVVDPEHEFDVDHEHQFNVGPKHKDAVGPENEFTVVPNPERETIL